MRAAERAEQARERGDQRVADYWQHIADVVSQAPPLTPAQQDKLRVLLRPDTKATSPQATAA